MAKVWVQLWTAKVAGAVQVEESELRQVQGLELVKPLVPMLVEVSEKEWAMVPTVLVKDSPLVQVSDLVKVQEMDLARAEELLEVLEPWRD
jgi:hypothetical protein